MRRSFEEPKSLRATAPIIASSFWASRYAIELWSRSCGRGAVVEHDHCRKTNALVRDHAVKFLARLLVIGRVQPAENAALLGLLRGGVA
jgi:hypothetical protein